MVSGQWPVASGQLPVASCQLPVTSYQWPDASDQLPLIPVEVTNKIHNHLPTILSVQGRLKSETIHRRSEFMADLFCSNKKNLSQLFHYRSHFVTFFCVSNQFLKLCSIKNFTHLNCPLLPACRTTQRVFRTIKF